MKNINESDEVYALQSFLEKFDVSGMIVSHEPNYKKVKLFYNDKAATDELIFPISRKV